MEEDAVPKDFYIILGITKGADLNQIKRAYRRIAKQSHPDLTHTPSTDEFLEIKEAYDTLSDSDKRRQYDIELEKQNIPVSIIRYPEMTNEKRTVYDEMDLWKSTVDEFFEGFLPGLFTKERFRPPDKDLYYEMVLTPDEALDGGLFPIKLPVIEPCLQCDKSGIWEDFFCSVCLGHGRIRSDREFSLNIPPHISHGTHQKVYLGDVGLKDMYLNILVLIDSNSPF